jgi:hypothetical protein
MKTMLRAAAALSLGIGSAYADGSLGQSGGYVYPDYQSPTRQNAPSAATAQNGRAIHNYVTRSNHGTWLFPPNSNEGANN